MHDFLDELASLRRFGMKPGLDAISRLCAALGDPQKRVRAIHVAGTNGKGAVCAMLDECLRADGFSTGRYTSPHLVRINERFFLDGSPVDDATLERASAKVASAAPEGLTFFEALTAIAFLVYSEAECDFTVLETGLGGRLDATNVCRPDLCVITRIGLDHCDWLGDTAEKIASEKAGIVKHGVPIVLGRNEPSVVDVVKRRAEDVGAPFHYAPDIASESDIIKPFALAGSFNRENAVTAIAAMKVLGRGNPLGLANVKWPGRFDRVGPFIIDGAHNPPAAKALASALGDLKGLSLVAGFCGDKDVDEVLSVLAPFAGRGYAVKTNNPRSLEASETAAKMRAAGIDAIACGSLEDALERCKNDASRIAEGDAQRPSALVCGSLFLAGEALVALGAYPWRADRFDAAESLHPSN